MKKKIIVTLALSTIAYAEIENNPDPLPDYAKPGECFTKAFYPPKYKTVKTIKSIKRVLVSDESVKYEVIPPEYNIYTERVKIADGMERIITLPAKYKDVTERILVQPAEKIWKRGSQKAFSACVDAARNMGMEVDNAEVGTCYYEHYRPAQYRTTTSKVLVADASERIEVIPATYRTIQKRILVDNTTEKLIPLKPVYKKLKDKVAIAPARTEWKKTICSDSGCDQSEILCLTEVPTTYKKITRRVVLKKAVKKIVDIAPIYKTYNVKELVTPATTRIITIPAKYKTIKKKIKETEAESFWTDSLGKNEPTRLRSECDKICLTQKPAEYKTINKHILVQPAESKKLYTEPKYTTMKIRQVIQKASFKEVVIPKEYITVVTERERTKGHARWMPMICESQMTSSIVKKVQEALKFQGFYFGEIDGQLDLKLKSAIRAYQKANGLAVTRKLSIETMKSLSIY